MYVGFLLNSPRVVPPATSAIFALYTADSRFTQAMHQEKGRLDSEAVGLRRLLSEEKAKSASLRDAVAKMICE